MVSSQFGLLAKSFLSGAVFTVSISYPFYLRQTSSSQRTQMPRAEHSSLFPFGKPVDLKQTIEYAGHTLCYDAARKQPLWVSELLTKDSIKGKANRRHSKFGKDDKVDDRFSAANSDFLKSGWSRGHMAAAGNFKSSQRAMDDTFYLTNIVPQDYDNNSGFWNRLETHCRDLTQKFDKVHVITGPLYQNNIQEGEKRYVKYEVIGENRIPAPTHLYKVVVAYNGGQENNPFTAAFVVPNIAISREENELSKYQVTLEQLDTLTGFNFHPDLGSQRATDLCAFSHDACKLKSWKDLELYFASRKVEYAKSQQDIDAAVANLKKYDIKLGNKLRNQIDKKQMELRHYSAK